MLEFTSALNTTLSVAASPRVTSPLSVVAPEAVSVVKAPEEAVVLPMAVLSIVPALISAVSATRLSMFAVPSM